MFDELQEIINHYIEGEKIAITGDMVLLTDLGMNSYELIQLIYDIEEKFNIKIPERSIRDFKTVQNVLDYITIANLMEH